MTTHKRGFIVEVQTRLFKKPIITISDGYQEVKFEGCGTFTIDTNVEYPKPIIKPDVFNQFNEE